jgi:hypothetical protein
MYIPYGIEQTVVQALPPCTVVTLPYARIVPSRLPLAA